MKAKTKRNLALGTLGLGLLFMLGMGGDEDEDDDGDEDLDEPGTPGGQTPEEDPNELDPLIFIPWTGDWPLPSDEPTEPADPGSDVPFAPFTPPGEDPWNPTVYEHPENYPTPGRFHQVVSGDIFFGKGSRHNLAWAALYEAAYQAAIEVGEVSDDEARAFAKLTAGKGSNRVKYTDLILCSPFNDMLYGTYGYGKQAHVGPHGRSIRMMPYHADNRALILQRQPPVRNIQMRSPNDAKKGNARAVSSELRETWEYLWLPPLNLQALWETGQITTEGLAWEDGSSMMWAPPEISNLGVDYIDDPGLREYGCLGGEMEVE